MMENTVEANIQTLQTAFNNAKAAYDAADIIFSEAKFMYDTVRA